MMGLWIGRAVLSEDFLMRIEANLLEDQNLIKLIWKQSGDAFNLETMEVLYQLQMTDSVT